MNMLSKGVPAYTQYWPSATTVGLQFVAATEFVFGRLTTVPCPRRLYAGLSHSLFDPSLYRNPRRI